MHLQGLVRSIGVSNFSIKKLEDILSYAQIPPAVCQVCPCAKFNAYHQRTQAGSALVQCHMPLCTEFIARPCSFLA